EPVNTATNMVHSVRDEWQAYGFLRARRKNVVGVGWSGTSPAAATCRLLVGARVACRAAFPLAAHGDALRGDWPIAFLPLSGRFFDLPADPCLDRRVLHLLRCSRDAGRMSSGAETALGQSPCPSDTRLLLGSLHLDTSSYRHCTPLFRRPMVWRLVR